MSTIALPSWVKVQSLTPPTIMRSTLASTGRYSGHTDIGDFMSGDVWAMSVGLVPMARDDSPRLEALVNQLVGGLNLLSCHHLGSPLPRGTLRGSPVLSAAMVQGAQAMPVSGALSAPNIVRGGGFEIDTNSDGLADGLTGFGSGSVGSVTQSFGVRVGPVGARSQRVDFTGLGTGDGDRAGFFFDTTYATDQAAGTYTASAYGLANGNVMMKMQVDFISGGTVVGSTGQVALAGGTSPAPRITGLATTAAWRTVRVYLWATGIGSAQTDSIWWDCVQVEPGAAASEYAGPARVAAGDMLGVGNSIFQAADDFELNDAGSGAIPMVNKARSTIASATPVIWNKPAALWRLSGTPQMLIVPGYAQGVQLDLVEKAFA